MTSPGRQRHLYRVSGWPRGARIEGVESGPPFPSLTHLRPVAVLADVSRNVEVFRHIGETVEGWRAACAPTLEQLEKLRAIGARFGRPDG